MHSRGGPPPPGLREGLPSQPPPAPRGAYSPECNPVRHSIEDCFHIILQFNYALDLVAFCSRYPEVALQALLCKMISLFNAEQTYLAILATWSSFCPLVMDQIVSINLTLAALKIRVTTIQGSIIYILEKRRGA